MIKNEIKLEEIYSKKMKLNIFGLTIAIHRKLNYLCLCVSFDSIY